MGQSVLGVTAFVAAGLVWVGGAAAQQGIDQVEKRFDLPRAPLSQAGRVIPEFDPLAAPPAASGVTFRLNDIEIVGNTAVSDAELRVLYVQLLGTDVSVGQLFAIANSVTAFYGQRGFPLSRAIVPAQEIDGSGVVRLQVIEGYVDQAIIEGPGKENTLVRQHGEALTGERPISNRTLERHLLLADDLPGISAKSVLRSGGITRLRRNPSKADG